MTDWRENKVVGIVAGVIAIITFGIVILNVAKNAAKFKKVPSEKILPAGPMDVNR